MEIPSSAPTPRAKTASQSATHFTFKRLLAPISEEEFFNEYWERRPLHIAREDPSYYGSQSALNELDELIGGHSQERRLDLITNGEDRAHVRMHGMNAILGRSEIYDAFRNGATLRMKAMEEQLPLGQQVAATLEQHTSSPVHINMYLTPRNSQGFGAHHDGHDVFILQTEGVKHWEVYEEPVELPHDGIVTGRSKLFAEGRTRYMPNQVDPENPPEAIIATTLHPGDFLYIPRGFYHQAWTTDAPSMHLTVGSYVFTWQEAVVCALADAFGDAPDLRRALPPRFGRDEIDADVIDRVIDAVHETLDADRMRKALRALYKAFAFSRKDTFQHLFRTIDDIHDIEAHESVSMRPGVVHHVDDVEGEDKIDLFFNGRHVRLPSVVGPVIDFIDRTATFTANDLPVDLGEGDKLKIVQHLLGQGFLLRAFAPTSSIGDGAPTSSVEG